MEINAEIYQAVAQGTNVNKCHHLIDFSPTCAGLGVAGLEGHLGLAAALAHAAAGAGLYPPPPRPRARATGGGAAAPAPPG